MTPEQKALKKLIETLPGIDIQVDREGQIVIYTDLMYNEDENIVPFEEE